MFVMLMACSRSSSRRTRDYKLNLIIGLFLWDFFAEGTKAGLMSLDARGFLLTKARCPAWILVVTSISNAAITLAVFAVIIVAFLSWPGGRAVAGAVLLFLGYCVALVADRRRLLAGRQRAVPPISRSESGLGYGAAGRILRGADHLSARHPARAVPLSISISGRRRRSSSSVADVLVRGHVPIAHRASLSGAWPWRSR